MLGTRMRQLRLEEAVQINCLPGRDTRQDDSVQHFAWPEILALSWNHSLRHETSQRLGE